MLRQYAFVTGCGAIVGQRLWLRGSLLPRCQNLFYGRDRKVQYRQFRTAQVRAAAVDLRFVRENADLVSRNAENRAVNVDVALVVNLYDEVYALAKEVDALRRRRNEIAGRMKGAGKMKKEDRDACIVEGKDVKEAVAKAEFRLEAAQLALEAESAKLPNMSHPDVPVGSENNAKLIRAVGAPRDFAAEGIEARDHLEIATNLDMIDFENAARVSGNKFYYLRNAGALLELALINWAMSRAAKHGFMPMTTPDLARENIVTGCGFQPRGEASQVYRIEDTDLCLVGTAEIPLGGYYAGQILEKDQLPIRMAAYSHCFRKEVGAAGGATRGLYRVHQFSKVEMFVLCLPEDSDRLHQELLDMEEAMFRDLDLHFQVLDMPTEDLGAPAHRKFDIEAWMPGRRSYGEISSASNCTCYQARRLNIRYRESIGDNRFVHTLNATACAVPRMIVAILENNVQADGSVRVPEVLRPFMGGLEYIKPPAVSKACAHAGASAL